MTTAELTAGAAPTTRRDDTASPSLAARIPTLLTGVATLLLGLMAGFFYAYTCTVMVGLAYANDVTFISAMQEINAHVRNTPFAVGFFGSLVFSVVALLAHLPRPKRRVALALGGAALCYAAAFAITLTQSVPLNDQLGAVGDPTKLADPAAVRAAYEAPWVLWNNIRTGFSTLAFASSALAFRWIGKP